MEEACSFLCGRGRGAVLSVYDSKGSLSSHIHQPIHTIHSHVAIPPRKKTFSKPQVKMHDFIYKKDDICAINEKMMGMGGKSRKRNGRKLRKNPPFIYPRIPLSIIWRPTVFRSPRGPEKAGSSLMREGTKLMGQRKHWVACGERS